MSYAGVSHLGYLFVLFFLYFSLLPRPYRLLYLYYDSFTLFLLVTFYCFVIVWRLLDFIYPLSLSSYDCRWLILFYFALHICFVTLHVLLVEVIIQVYFRG